MANLFSHDFSKNQVRLDIQRSTFTEPHQYLGTCNTGDLNICYCEEVLPGDTFDIDTGALIRMATPIHPTMSKSYCDLHFYFVPFRLVWDHWEEFLGVNKDSFWAQPTTYTVPQISAPSGGWSVGSLADQLGVRTGVSGFSVSALPFRAYGLIYNYYWRDKNLMTPIGVPTDDSNRTGTNGTNYITDSVLGGMPAKACKLADVYTTALPSPQKGNPVTINLLGGSGYVPVNTSTGSHSVTVPLTFSDVSHGSSSTTFVPSNVDTYLSLIPNKINNVDTNKDGDLTIVQGASTSGITFTQKQFAPNNLMANLNGAIQSVSINDLRLAFATQRILEAQARSGCSYQELLSGVYGVSAGDSRLQMPEYLGGKHFDINIAQVIQTSSTDTTSPQGNTAAMSLTFGRNIGFKKSFVEHGLVLGVYTVRPENIYQQGLPKFLTKKNRYDFYWPQLSNIGEVGIKTKELYVSGNSTIDESIFGYQEAWYEYRHHPNMITGEFRSDYNSSLDSWHYGIDFSSAPILGPTFIQSGKSEVDRTLAVTSHSQYLVNFSIFNKPTRPLPMYSIPGLIDHH